LLHYILAQEKLFSLLAVLHMIKINMHDNAAIVIVLMMGPLHY
jgi:hypothetical protein